MEIELDVWRTELLHVGIVEMPLKGSTAVRAGQLQSFHGDPADRTIVATAIETSAGLITAEEKILSWSQSNQVIQAINARM